VVEGSDEDVGAFGVEVAVEDPHPVQRFVDVEVAAFVDLACVELGQSSSAMPRQWRATTPN
jgi:hypothetical protein